MGFVAIGVDIGQKVDPTAITVVEVEPREHPESKRREDYYIVRHLARLPLGTPYPVVVAQLAELVAKVRDRAQQPAIWRDSTGVGQPVVDLLKASKVRVTPCYFTHGDRLTTTERGDISLGKALLVSLLQVLMQAGRILLPKTAEAQALAKELLDYEIHVDERANDTYGAFKTGAHDDMVTSLGLAVLAAERGAGLPFGWYRQDPVFMAGLRGTSPAERNTETDTERITRRRAATGMPLDEQPHRYGAPLPNPWAPERHE